MESTEEDDEEDWEISVGTVKIVSAISCTTFCPLSVLEVFCLFRFLICLVTSKLLIYILTLKLYVEIKRTSAARERESVNYAEKDSCNTTNIGFV